MIALDAMGGDFAPYATVAGAVRAAQNGIPISLFGNEKKIIPLLFKAYSRWEQLPILIVHCSQTISMYDQASRSVIQQKNSSLVRAIQSVAQGDNQAVVSAGNSGATLVAATLLLERARGVLRPAIGNFIPTKKSSLFCIDLGANADCKPEFLEQFGYMGAVYVRMIRAIQDPRVALLSNGEEPYKGSVLVKNAYQLLEKSDLNFVGNVQSREMFDDKADVLVCDGFSGNILLKGIQGTAGLIKHWLADQARRSWFHRLYFALGYSIFKQLSLRSDYAKKAGALLLGVNYPLVVAHGCSSADAIEQSIYFAHHVAREKFINSFNKQFFAVINKNPFNILPISHQLRSFFDMHA